MMTVGDEAEPIVPLRPSVAIGVNNQSREESVPT
jgi:hypothetical protein